MTINLPISLTLIRLIISPIVLPFLLFNFFPTASTQTHYLLAGLFAFLTLTDFFDGYLARKYGQVTKVGALLDPMADKFLVFSTLITLLALGQIYFFWVIIFIGREFFVLGFRIAALERGFSIPVDWFGKLKTVAQSFYLLILIGNDHTVPLVDQVEYVSLITALVLTLISGIHYYRSFSKRWERYSSNVHSNEIITESLESSHDVLLS